ncbi:MAG TPA: nuclear transport factor 2 family protein [Puia sp.]|nr:nuclear transport factor 2 family protein [Puia sp.]
MSEIRVMTDAFAATIYEKDLEGFLSLFDSGVNVFDMWEQWSYEGLAAWREMVKGWFAGLGAERDVVSFEEVQIQEAGDMGFLTAIVRFAAVSAEGKELRFLQERLTWVLRRKDGGWKIVHQHTSVPLDGGTMKGILQR